MQSKQLIGALEGDRLQNSAMAQGCQSQQHLKVASQQKVHKSPSSYMSEENAPPHMILEQRKAKFYAQIVALKDTRLIENLSSLKSQKEKQKCIDKFSELYNEMLKSIVEMGDIIKQIRFTVGGNSKANAPTVVQSQASAQNNNNGNTINASSNAQNQVINTALNVNDPKNIVDMSELPDQIIKDCKSIHNIFADLVQDSSLKHLEMCCEIFALQGNSINLKFKISQWYGDVKEYIEKSRALNPSNNLDNKKNASNSGKGIGSILCPCFGQKAKPAVNKSTSLNRNNTTQAIQNQRTTLDPPN